MKEKISSQNLILLLLSIALLISIGYNIKQSRQGKKMNREINNLEYDKRDLEDKVDELEEK